MSFSNCAEIQALAMLRSKRPPDRSKIELDDPEVVKYWTKHLGVTADELQRVIEKVGNAAAAVRKELKPTNMPSNPSP